MGMLNMVILILLMVLILADIRFTPLKESTKQVTDSLLFEKQKEDLRDIIRSESLLMLYSVTRDTNTGLIYIVGERKDDD